MSHELYISHLNSPNFAGLVCNDTPSASVGVLLIHFMCFFVESVRVCVLAHACVVCVCLHLHTYTFYGIYCCVWFFPPSLSLFLSLCLSLSVSLSLCLSSPFFLFLSFVCDMPHLFVIHNTRIRMYISTHIYMYAYMHMCTHNRTYVCLGWLRLVGPFKL